MVREPLPTERTLLQSVAVARWGTWAWLAAALLQHDDLRHPVVASLAMVLALVWAGWTPPRPGPERRPC